MVTERDFFINCVFKLKWRSSQVLTCFGLVEYFVFEEKVSINFGSPIHANAN